MKPKFVSNANVDIGDILSQSGYHLVVDDWIDSDVPCVLLYKDGTMAIYPIEAYTGYELTMLQREAIYKSPWIPIRYGSFLEMQECMDEIVREGLCAINAKSPDVE